VTGSSDDNIGGCEMGDGGGVLAKADDGVDVKGKKGAYWLRCPVQSDSFHHGGGPDPWEAHSWG